MMSEPETKIEIEDVLSSIRRLVSRDAGAARPMPVPPPAPAAPPEVAAEPAPLAAEAECLVLTPALRIGEEDAETEAEIAAEHEDPVAVGPEVKSAAEVDGDVCAEIADEVENGVDVDLQAEIGAAAMASPERMVEPEPEPESEPVEAEILDFVAPALALDPALAEEAEAAAPLLPAEAPAEIAVEPAVDTAAETPAAADVGPAFDASAPFLLQPSAAVSPSDIRPFAVVPASRPMTEAEVLLAEAEAALAETGVVLEDASSAIDAAGEGDAALAEEVADPGTGTAIDLGDELSRLESTIAELEAAVAESGFDFEPDTGHPFALEPEAAAAELPDAFEAEVRQAIETPAPEALAEPSAEETALAEDVASAEDVVLAEPGADPQADGAEAWSADAAEEALEAAAEAELLAQQDHAAELQAEMADPERQAETGPEEPGVGMDWAEATLNLARRTPPRRLAVSEAEETVQTAATMRSSYEELREELAQDLEEASELYAEELVPSYEDGLIDEAVLRDMVAQLVREELRGSLGERITQNVRKLVRREIQRALLGQDYD